MNGKISRNCAYAKCPFGRYASGWGLHFTIAVLRVHYTSCLVLSCGGYMLSCCQIVLWPVSPMNMQPAPPTQDAWHRLTRAADGCSVIKEIQEFLLSSGCLGPAGAGHTTIIQTRGDSVRNLALSRNNFLSIIGKKQQVTFEIALHWFLSLFIIWECVLPVCTLYLSIYFLRCRATESFLLKNFHISLRNFKTR